MKLFIDTSNSEKIQVGLDDQRVEESSRQDKSQKLLQLVVDELYTRGRTLKDLSEIEVVLGPGSFTGLRVGIAVANALAWSLGVTVNGKKKVVEPRY